MTAEGLQKYCRRDSDKHHSTPAVQPGTHLSWLQGRAAASAAGQEDRKHMHTQRTVKCLQLLATPFPALPALCRRFSSQTATLNAMLRLAVDNFRRRSYLSVG